MAVAVEGELAAVLSRVIGKLGSINRGDPVRTRKGASVWPIDCGSAIVNLACQALDRAIRAFDSVIGAGILILVVAPRGKNYFFHSTCLVSARSRSDLVGNSLVSDERISGELYWQY